MSGTHIHKAKGKWNNGFQDSVYPPLQRKWDRKNDEIGRSRRLRNKLKEKIMDKELKESEMETSVENLDLLIKQKTKELLELRTQKSQLESSKYDHYKGRFFRLAATCHIRIDNVMNYSNNELYISGLKITGMKDLCNEFFVEKEGYETFYLDKNHTEISAKEFYGIFLENVECWEKFIAKECGVDIEEVY